MFQKRPQRFETSAGKKSVSIDTMSQDVVASLFPLLFMVVACVVVPAALYFRQRAAELQYWKMIHGTRNPPFPESWMRRNSYLLRGLVWLVVGIGISTLFGVMYRVEQDPGLLAMATLGSIPAGVGVAHLVVHRLQPKPPPPASNEP
jgi:hypothetical protein